MMDKDEEYADVIRNEKKDDELEQGKKDDEKNPGLVGSDDEDEEHEFQAG